MAAFGHKARGEIFTIDADIHDEPLVSVETIIACHGDFLATSQFDHPFLGDVTLFAFGFAVGPAKLFQTARLRRVDTMQAEFGAVWQAPGIAVGPIDEAVLFDSGLSCQRGCAAEAGKDRHGIQDRSDLNAAQHVRAS